MPVCLCALDKSLPVFCVYSTRTLTSSTRKRNTLSIVGLQRSDSARLADFLGEVARLLFSLIPFYPQRTTRLAKLGARRHANSCCLYRTPLPLSATSCSHAVNVLSEALEEEREEFHCLWRNPRYLGSGKGTSKNHESTNNRSVALRYV